MSLSDGHHTRKMVAGACMVLAPLFLLASAIVHPDAGTSAASQAAAIADQADAWYAAHALALASVVLAVPAVLGLMHMLREKRVLEGHVGGALALLGLLAFTGVIAIEMALWQAGDEAATAAMIDRVGETAGLVVPFTAMSFGLVAGFIVLAYGLYAAHAINAPMAACIAIGAALLAVATATATMWAAIAAGVVLALGLGATGLMVLSETDAEWEHTPEFHGLTT